VPEAEELDHELAPASLDGRPVICTDAGSGRAQRLAEAVGGEVAAGNGELADRASVVFLCHKPNQLATVAEQLGGRPRVVVSVLAGVSVERLAGAFPGTPVMRVALNLAVAVRNGVVAFGGQACVSPELEREVRDLLAPLGVALDVPEDQLAALSAVSGVGIAYGALLLEAQVDAAIRHGLPAELAGALARHAMSGTVALTEGGDTTTLALRRAVASPGGTTAAGLAALEHAGVRRAFDAAADAVVGASARAAA
jgi:pyrroline-5-carboxylate reductase